MTALSALLLLLPGGQSLSSPPGALPAYAHNDYLNERPLSGALELGFRGVEVDYFLLEGELCVGHELEDTRTGRTIESLYLAPLREYFGDEGGAPPEGRPFLLNIESKREGIETYEALHELLARYADILTVVRSGVEKPGPVQVILVGWRPGLEYLRAQPVRYAAVQMHYRDLPEDHARYPAHLIKLVSQNYNMKLLARGRGVVSPRLRQRFEDVAQAAHQVPGRLARVYNVPTKPAAYEAILDAGIDLIGTRDIAGAHEILSAREAR